MIKIKELEPIMIDDLDQKIRQTPTYQKFLNFGSFIFNNIIYRVEFCWAPNGQGKFHVDLYDTEHHFEAGEYHSIHDSNDSWSINHNNTVVLARLIYKQIMDEVKYIVKNELKIKNE